MEYKQLCCKVVDSSMTTWTLKQDKMQELFNNLKEKDIISQVGNEDITELLWELICSFGYNNKYDLERIINNLQDILLEIEVNNE